MYLQRSDETYASPSKIPGYTSSYEFLGGHQPSFTISLRSSFVVPVPNLLVYIFRKQIVFF